VRERERERIFHEITKHNMHMYVGYFREGITQSAFVYESLPLRILCLLEESLMKIGNYCVKLKSRKLLSNHENKIVTGFPSNCFLTPTMSDHVGVYHSN
jgi:hypothetical protein